MEGTVSQPTVARYYASRDSAPGVSGDPTRPGETTALKPHVFYNVRFFLLGKSYLQLAPGLSFTPAASFGLWKK